MNDILCQVRGFISFILQQKQFFTFYTYVELNETVLKTSDLGNLPLNMQNLAMWGVKEEKKRGLGQATEYLI